MTRLETSLHASGTQAMKPIRNERKWLWMLLALALLLRCSNFVFQMRIEGDETGYAAIALNVINGNGYRDGDWYAWRYPGHCYFLAGVYLLSGIRPTPSPVLNYEDIRQRGLSIPPLALAIQVALSVWLCYLLFCLARKAFDSRAALIALAMMAIYIPFVRLPGRLYSENLALPLFLWFSLVYWSLRDRPTVAKAVGAGILAGLCSLCRESAVAFFVPAVAIEFLLFRSKQKRVPARYLALILLVGAAVLAPWTIRNYRLFGVVVPLTTNGATNIYLGAQPNATGFSPMPELGARYGKVKLFPPPPRGRYHHDPDARVFQEIEIGREQLRQSRLFIRDHTWRWIKLGLWKSYCMWTLPSVIYFNVHGTVERAAEIVWDISYLLLVIPGLLGAWSFRLRLAELSIPYSLLIIPTVLTFLTLAVSRFRLPTEIALMFFAGGAIGLWIERRSTTGLHSEARAD